MSSATNNRHSFYNSSPESDCEVDGGSTSPRANSRINLASMVGSSNTLSSTGVLHGKSPMARSTSDPSLAAKEEGKEETQGNASGIPDYNVPPPYAVTPKQVGSKAISAKKTLKIAKSLFY